MPAIATRWHRLMTIRQHVLSGDIGDGALVARLLANIARSGDQLRRRKPRRSFDRCRRICTDQRGRHAGLLEAVRDTGGSLEGAAKGAAAKRISASCTSHDEAMARSATRQVTEETAFAPNSPYSASKAASDHWLGARFNLPTGCRCSPPTARTTTAVPVPEKAIPLIIAARSQANPARVLAMARTCATGCMSMITARDRRCWSVPRRRDYNVVAMRAPEHRGVNTICAR